MFYSRRNTVKNQRTKSQAKQERNDEGGEHRDPPDRAGRRRARPGVHGVRAQLVRLLPTAGEAGHCQKSKTVVGIFFVPAARNWTYGPSEGVCWLNRGCDVCVVDVCSGAVCVRLGLAGGLVVSLRTCMSCREFLAFRSCSLGLIGTVGQEAWSFPLSLNGGFSRHSI